MSAATSPGTGLAYGLQRVCAAWGFARSSFYAMKCPPSAGDRSPRSRTRLCWWVSPWEGEGHRKPQARDCSLRKSSCGSVDEFTAIDIGTPCVGWHVCKRGAALQPNGACEENSRPPPVRRGGWPCGWITAPSICRTTSPTRSSSQLQSSSRRTAQQDPDETRFNRGTGRGDGAVQRPQDPAEIRFRPRLDPQPLQPPTPSQPPRHFQT